MKGQCIMWRDKVEKILKGRLDSIPSPSPSVKILIMGNKVCFRCKGKTLLGGCQQTFENKNFVDITQQCFALLPQVNFATNNLNFYWRWRWWDQIFSTLWSWNWTSYVSISFLFIIQKGMSSIAKALSTLTNLNAH